LKKDYTYYYSKISEKEFFDSIKVGSLLAIEWPVDNIIIDKIKEKFYEINLVQIVKSKHYYLIESPTLTKPARKNNSNN